MENKEKLRKLANTIIKVLHIFRIIFIVGMAICAVASVTSLVFGLTGALEKIYEAHPKIGNLELVDIDFLNKERKLSYYYDKGELDLLCYGAAIACFIGVVYCVLAFVIAKLVESIFKTLADAETPLTIEVVNKLRVAFIIAFIITVCSNFFVGLVIGGLFACIYFILLYGCSLQDNEDKTL